MTRLAFRTVAALAAAGSILGTSACGSEVPIEAWPELPLADGSTLSTRSEGVDGLMVALIYDPTDCFTCFGTVPDWQTWSRHHPGRLATVFTREPGKEELAVLRRYRLPSEPVFDPEIPKWKARTPVELALVGGEVVYARPVPAEQTRSRLLECLRLTEPRWVGCITRLAERSGPTAGRPNRDPERSDLPTHGSDPKLDPSPTPLTTSQEVTVDPQEWPRTYVLCVIERFEPLAEDLRPGRRPLIVVDGVPRERLDPEAWPTCDEGEPDLSRIEELSYRIPESATRFWGEDGVDGAIVVVLTRARTP